jgi:hypothetical protein
MLARIAALVPLAAVPLGLYLMSPLAPLAAETEFSSPSEKLRQLVFPFANYLLPLDIATACAVGIFLLGCIAKGRCRVTASSSVVLLLIGSLYLATPWAFKGTYFFDIRFMIMLGFLLFGAVLPTGLPRSATLTAIAFFTLLFVIRMAIVGSAWVGHRGDVADIRTVITTVEPGARVFVTSVSPEEAPGYWQGGPLSRQLSNGIRVDYHLAALLLIERRAFWPFLFDNPSQQPVETLPPYRAMAEDARSLPDHGALAVPGKVDLCGYDYLLLLEAGGEPDFPHFAVDRLVLLTRTDFAALFRVRSIGCAH